MPLAIPILVGKTRSYYCTVQFIPHQEKKNGDLLKNALGKSRGGSDIADRVVNLPEAANSLVKAVDIYTDMGRFTIAAKHHQTIAEIYENDIGNPERAMQHYEQSADYFRVRTSQPIFASVNLVMGCSKFFFFSSLF